MRRYDLVQHPDSRYASMEILPKARFVEFDDMMALFNDLCDAKMVSDQYDMLVQHGIIKDDSQDVER